MRVY
ncbi:hypothetical protein CP061683_1246A, partial [Chlamydia psittaci 06-1683]|jgi:hypothetical protein